MKTSLEIAQEAQLEPIDALGARIGLLPEEIEPYGRYKAKISLDAIDRLSDKPDAKLVCVAGMTPTRAGEGKTTTSVGLTEGLGYIGKSPVLCLREPSLGPVFGIKGGAAGGGLAQVVPMEDLNLHFTGDIHAIGAANNLLAALLDASILHGNPHKIDALRVTWKRAVDMNDRALRAVALGLGGATNGYPRESGFDITAASEVMAILAVARDIHDLRERLGRITAAYSHEGEPVTADDLGAAGAMTVLLKDAIKPNLIQTLEGQPCLMHAGPFANIAHGNSSLIADLLGLKLGDYVVTESGFGSDMGMEKFIDIVCRAGGISPERGRPGRDGASPEAPRWPRRGRAGEQEARRRGDRGRDGQPAPASRHRRGVRPARRWSRSTAGRRTPTRRSSWSSAWPRRAVRPAPRSAPDSPTAAGGRRSWPRPWSPPATGRVTSGRSTRMGMASSPRSRPSAPACTARPRSSTTSRQSERSSSSPTRGSPISRLHGEDAALALGRPGAARRADRLPAPGARCPRLHRRGLARAPLRRHPADAGFGQDARRAQR